MWRRLASPSDSRLLPRQEEWRNAKVSAMKSRSVFGMIRMEIIANYHENSTSCIQLVVTDTDAEALVEKERKENPLKYDRELELRLHVLAESFWMESQRNDRDNDPIWCVCHWHN